MAEAPRRRHRPAHGGGDPVHRCGRSAYAFRVPARNTRGPVERRARVRARLAGTGALVGRYFSPPVADQAGGCHSGGEPVLSGTAYDGASGMAVVRRDVQPSAGSGHGTRYARGLAGGQALTVEYRPNDPAVLADPFPLY